MNADTLRLIGDTPVVRLPVPDGHADIWAKLESRNVGGSVKDRIARAMIEAARATGELQPGAPVVEATSGNTGIGLAVVCAALGHELVLVMPESVSEERIIIAQALGATVITTPADDGMRGAIEATVRLAEERAAYWPRQFENPANPLCHELTTGPELRAAVPGCIASFVAGVGTGGTITGVGRHLRANDPDVRIVAVEPASSAVLSGGEPGPHMIGGIGAGFVPPLLDRGMLDAIETVSDLEAWTAARALAREAGLFVGVSAGAAVAAATREAKRLGSGRVVATLLPDGGDRYVSLARHFGP